MSKELIISGYPSQHAALLALTTLSRQHNKIPLANQNIAVIYREENGELTILESIILGVKLPSNESVWKTLAQALFPEEDDSGTKQRAEQEWLESIGIDPRSAERISKVVPKGSTAVLVMADENSRTRITAILSALHGTITRVRLHWDRADNELTAIKNHSLE
jgi:uncharacterized membrane protein